MREFFKPWRRKLGVLTLLLACMFTGLWVRSRDMYDDVYCCPSGRVIYFLSSHNRGLSWEADRVIHPRQFHAWDDYPLYEFRSWESRSSAATANTFFEAVIVKTRFELAGFFVGVVVHYDVGFECSLWKIPHWSIVLPLTLLSAFLLLSRPRPKPTSRERCRYSKHNSIANPADPRRGQSVNHG